MISSDVGRTLNIPNVRILNIPVRKLFISFPELKPTELIDGRRTLILPTVFTAFARLDDLSNVLLVIVRIVVFVQAETERAIFSIGVVIFRLLL